MWREKVQRENKSVAVDCESRERKWIEKLDWESEIKKLGRLGEKVVSENIKRNNRNEWSVLIPMDGKKILPRNKITIPKEWLFYS